MVSDRLQRLTQFVELNPDDAFARYGLAMELMRAGQSDAALAEFARLHDRHPDYPAAFQQAGQLLLSLGRPGEAAATLKRGIAAAHRKGDGHAAAEMQALLDEAGD